MPKRILIVDDQEELRALLVDALEASGDGYEIRAAGDGARALEEHARSPVDLVITDLDMPVMNGLELIRRLRAAPPPPAIVVISGASADWMGERSPSELHALPFLRKPLVLAELVREVRRQLGD